MKKLLFAALILALFNSVSASADVVSLDKATAAARQYFNDGAVTRAGAIEPVLAWTYNEVTKGPYAPAFYVFNNPQGGWMIISGEDACHAILAHSDTGSFDPQTLPENTAWWLDGYAEQIEWARMNYIKQDAQTAAEWDDLLSGNIRKTTVNPQCPTPSWDQRAPFSNYCPYYFDSSSNSYKRCVTGCVATAVAEVMYYHAVTRNLRLPEKGHGTIGGYSQSKVIYKKVDESYVQIENNTLETINLAQDSGYDWANMLDSYSGNNITEDNKAAVAKLMYHCGLMCKMSYGSGSSADEERAVAALVENMGYDPETHIEYRSAYTESEWLKIIKTEIKELRPVIMYGRNTSSAHEFVADGFRDPDEFHMNWGWKGAGNGWFRVSAFQPKDSKQNEHDYRLSINAIIGAKPYSGDPPYDLSSPESLRLLELKYLSENVHEPIPNGKFYVKEKVVNASTKSFSGYFWVFLYDYSDSESTRTLVSEYIAFTGQPMNRIMTTDSWECNMNLSKSPRLGDKLRVCYALEKSPESSKPILAMIVNNNNHNEYTLHNNNIPVYDVPFIAVIDNGIYHIGDYFDFVITNSRTAPADMTIEWYFDGNNVTLDAITKQAIRQFTSDDLGQHTIKAVVTIGDVTQTLIQEITVVK